MARPFLLMVLFLSLLVGCISAPLSPPVEASFTPSQPVHPSASPALVRPVRTPTALPTPSQSVQEPTAPPVLPASPSPQRSFQGPDEVICPILLYHRIAIPADGSEYYVTPDEFRAQMYALKEWGYTPIRPSDLVRAITQGAELPLRPVIISFDDGDETVYTTAYPVMRELGFIGVNYLVANYVNTPGYMTTAQLQELASAGWEVGSHSVSHADLTQAPDVQFQVIQSRKTLETMLGVPVQTFAYPYGQANERILRTVSKHYHAGMGLGSSTTQRRQNLYYLWRRPVKLGWDVNTFGSFLPWNTPPVPSQP
ncbi:MAG: polysaccharide deacetylase family protein [Anaerolineales bacterium]|nr:polysaccharide deacetylase family protein [Anaerolineales bacterium]